MMFEPRKARRVCCGALILLYGCGAMANGRTQTVSFWSDPPGASVTVDDAVIGNTPTTADLNRRATHSVEIDKPGYIPYHATTTVETNKWAHSDMLVMLLPALLFPPALLLYPLDPGTYEIAPADINAHLIAATGDATTSAANTQANTAAPASK